MRHAPLTLLASLAAVAVALPAGAGNTDHTNHTPGDFEAVTCGDAANKDTIDVNGAPELWPPNHKYASYEVVATDADGDTDDDVTLTTSVTHDEYLTQFVPTEENQTEPEEEQGAGNTTMDAKPFWTSDSGDGSAMTAHDIRAERSGRGNGRQYTLNVTAEFDDATCTQSFTITVPHDLGQGAEHKPDHTD